MILKIEDKEYPIPVNLTLKKWRKLFGFSFDQENYEFIIHNWLDIPLEDVLKIPDETKELAIAILNAHMFPSIYKPVKLKINLNEITFGDFVDLDIYIHNGIHKNLDKVCKMLFDFEYSDDLFISDIHDGLMKYFNFRISIFNRYKNLFNIDDIPEEDEEDDKQKTPIEYIWWEIMMVLSDEKFLNIDEVVKKPLIQALNYISWNKDKKTKELNNYKRMNNVL